MKCKICNFVNYCKNNLLSHQEKQEFIPMNKDIVEDYDIDKMNEEFTPRIRSISTREIGSL